MKIADECPKGVPAEKPKAVYPHRVKLTANPMMRALHADAVHREMTIPACCNPPAFTYLIAGGDLVKIGQTTCLRERVMALQVSSPVSLRIIALMRGSGLEQLLHARFSDCRAHGEWFNLDAVIEGLKVELARSRALRECLGCSIVMGPKGSDSRARRKAIRSWERGLPEEKRTMTPSYPYPATP